MLRIFARSLHVPQRVTQLAVRTLTTSRATPLVSSLLKRSLPLPRLRPSSNWSNGLKGSNRTFSTKSRSKDKLMELEAQANARPGDANAQHALLKELSEKFPQLVVARFESGKFAANPACVTEYLKATEKLGVAGNFPGVATADSDVFESAYGSGREYMSSQSSQSQFQPSTSSYSSSSYQQYRSAPSEYQMPSAVQSHAANMLLGSNPNQPIYIKPIPESWTSIFVRTLVYVVAGGILFFMFVQWLTQQASSAMQQQAGAQVKPLHKELGANVKPGEKPEVAVTFQDVKGCDEAKAELQEIVAFLKNPEQFTRLGGKLPKGVLLLGPPGTGKTLLAKAVAGEAGVPFFYCSGSEFEEMYVGVGARRVRDLFAAAKRKSPCIIFIDEIDAVGGRRQFRDHQSAGRMTLNQLLTEMDGFQSSSGVIVIGATNFPRLLDKALTRPGRFDKHVVVSLPDIRGRTQILELYAAKIPLDKAVDLSKIARGTPGCSGADLSNLINMAALKASTNKKTHVTQKDLEDARDTVLMGAERKSMVQTDEDKRNTAYHEGGHTIMAIKTKGAYPIHKATILPRGQALGVTHMLPERDQYSMSRQQLVAKLDVAMGGYVAEELVFGPDNVTSGASNDLESATHIAREMVTRYGMGERLGRVAPENTNNLSQETQKMIDEDVKSLVDGAYARAKTVLTQNMGELHSLAKALQKYETLDSTEIKQVIAGQALQRDDAKAH